MSLNAYPRPSYSERAKIAFQYLMPQLGLTRTAGWLAEKEWGAFTHFVIKQFAKAYKVNFDEAEKSSPSDYNSFNEFFIRLKLLKFKTPLFSRNWKALNNVFI